MTEEIKSATKERITKILTDYKKRGVWCYTVDLIAESTGYRVDWVMLALAQMIEDGQVLEIETNPMRRRFELVEVK